MVSHNSTTSVTFLSQMQYRTGNTMDPKPLCLPIPARNEPLENTDSEYKKARGLLSAGKCSPLTLQALEDLVGPKRSSRPSACLSRSNSSLESPANR